MTTDEVKEFISHELDYNGKKVRLDWDGTCLLIEHLTETAFVASVNDPDVNGTGNVAIIFSNNFAQRIVEDED